MQGIIMSCGGGAVPIKLQSPTYFLVETKYNKIDDNYDIECKWEGPNIYVRIEIEGTDYSYEGIGDPREISGTIEQYSRTYTMEHIKLEPSTLYKIKLKTCVTLITNELYMNSEWIEEVIETVSAELKGEKIFTDSDTWVVPDGVTSIDIYCIGGGGSGKHYFPTETEDRCKILTSSTGGGGGGYSETSLNVPVTPGEELVISIGGGGWSIDSAVNGDPTAVTRTDPYTTLCMGLGGNNGMYHYISSCGTSSIEHTNYSVVKSGGDGGSGGGAAIFVKHGDYIPDGPEAGTYGRDGASFEFELLEDSEYFNRYKGRLEGGSGQGKTTVPFDDKENFSGNLYGKGGQGSSVSHLEPTPNTGMAGEGGYSIMNRGTTPGMKGASGLCVIRWGY